MSPDCGKRGYLLPKGCKELADVISSKGEIFISERTSVGEVAALLGQEPLSIIASLRQLGVFATVNQVADFETSSAVARRYGYAARLLDSRTMRTIALKHKYAAKRQA